MRRMRCRALMIVATTALTFGWSGNGLVAGAAAPTVRVAVPSGGAHPQVAPRSSEVNVVTSFFPDGVMAVSAGLYHSCAIIGKGSVYCWGLGDVGLLGRDLGNAGSNVTNSSVPLPVTTGALKGHTAVAISAGVLHTCVILDNGKVACWGSDAFGALGNPPAADGVSYYSFPYFPTPVLVDGGALAGHSAVAISVGAIYTCALLDDGGVACWGKNEFGEIGTPPTDPRWASSSATPIRISGGALTGHSAVAISAKNFHACALLDNGTVACWGNNQFGQLGDGTTTHSPTPVLVSGGAMTGHSAVAIAAGGIHTCALLDDGTVACWGGNYYGQIGTGPTTSGQWGPYSVTPILVSDGALAVHTAMSISAGGPFSCAGLDDGTAACWGGNADGELGDGTTTDSPVPVPAAPDAIAGHTIRSLVNGASYSCALLDSAAVACWGMNYYGQLGNGSTSGMAVPAPRVSVRPGDPIGVGSAKWVLLPAKRTAKPKMPGIPRFLAARARSTSVTLRWLPPRPNGSAPITGYRVEYSRNGRTWVDGGSTQAMSFTLTGLTNGVRYTFRVRSMNAAGVGVWSTARAMPYLTVPETPRLLTLVPQSGGIRITWRTPTSDGGSEITGYRVQRSTDRRTWVDATTTSLLIFTDTDLNAGQRYYYRISAVNIAGSSRPIIVSYRKPT